MTDRDRTSEIFLQACALPVEERAAFLDLQCAGDTDLREEVEAMLEADRQAETGGTAFMEKPIGFVAVDLATVSVTPDDCGPYRILETLGEGGMGVVYLAQQEEPVRRKVALKLILPGLGDGEVLARFDAERQALAGLNHPNIAKLLDAGASAQGRPYFVMEYVDGRPLTDYCDEKALDTRRRLQIFLAVCEALDHAHRGGIIHRDIKPSNVLVTEERGEPVPKVIDFGVAKATGGRLTERTLSTRLGQIVGTPEYMSPEQANFTEEGIGTSTDVYSLGVMLYELLSGRLPFDSGELYAGGFSEMQRMIREVDPPKPSTAVERSEAAVARTRGTDLVGLRRAVVGDLDWIVMRALEKDPSRRYRTAGELADDVRRHLRNEPVTVGPPSLSYRVGKLVRRRPMHAALAATLAVLLPLGGWLWLRSAEQGRELTRLELRGKVKRLSRAGRSPDELLRLAGEILELDGANPMGWRARAVAHFNRSRSRTEPVQRNTDREQALEAADRLIDILPGAAWPVHLKAYFLDDFGETEAATAIRSSVASSPADGEADFFEAKLIRDRGEDPEDLREAERLLTRSILVEETVHAVEERAYVRTKLGDLDGALDDYRLLTQIERSDFYPHWRIGWIRMRQGRFQDAEDQLRRAGDLVSDADRWRVEELRADSFARWSRALVGEDRRADALQRIRQAEKASRRTVSLAPERPGGHVNLGASLVERYRLEPGADRTLLDEGVKHYERARELASTPDFEDERRAADIALANSCDAYLTLGDAERALAYCVQATELLPDEPAVYYNLAGAYALLGRRPEALAALQRDLKLGDTDHGYLRQDPWFESLRTDPAFREILARMEQAARDR